jgi:hypothetical protein
MSGIIGTSPNMRSGTLGKYPVGHVIQTKTVYHQANPTEYCAGGATVDHAVMDITFTNCKAGSTFLIWYHASFTNDLHENDLYYNVKQTIGSGSETTLGGSYGSLGTFRWNGYTARGGSMSVAPTITNGVSMRYRMSFTNANASVTSLLIYLNTGATFTVQEISG